MCIVSSNQKGLYFVKPTRFILHPAESKLVSGKCFYIELNLVRCETKVVNDLMNADLPTKWNY